MYSLGSFLQPCCEGKLYLDVIWVGDDDVVFASVFIPLMHKAPFFSFIGQAHTEANLNFGVKIAVEKELKILNQNNSGFDFQEMFYVKYLLYFSLDKNYCFVVV